MLVRVLRIFMPWTILAMLGTLACDLTTFGLGQTAKPQIVIQSPAAGTEFREGDQVTVQTTSADQAGIVRVELLVDGVVVHTAAPPIPQGQVSFTVIQTWVATPGAHNLSVRAFNKSGAASDPALVAINVVASAHPSPIAQPTQVVQPPPLGAFTPTLPAIEITPPGTSATATLTATPRPRPTSTPAAPPGVYALSIRVDPPAPRRNQDVTFHVTFLNTMGAPQGYQWRVRIFEPDKRNSFGDTAPVRNDFQIGTHELASASNWGVRGPTGCRTFIARVFWIDQTSKIETEFLKPDGGPPSAVFPLECP